MERNVITSPFYDTASKKTPLTKHIASIPDTERVEVLGIASSSAMNWEGNRYNAKDAKSATRPPWAPSASIALSCLARQRLVG